jgi:RNA polymerase sigma-70 factor, ECF subfamily
MQWLRLTSGRLPCTPSLAGTNLMNSRQLSGLNDLQADAIDTGAMSGVQAHDRRALERLYLSYYGPLARFLSRIVAQSSAVDQIINDTFKMIWMCAEEFRGDSRVAAWIFGIGYRTARQSMRPQRVRGSLSFAEIFRGRETDCTSENPYIDCLQRRLNRLPLEERATLVLAYQMGFSVDEIAEITQVVPAAVKIRMSEACMGLRGRSPDREI